MALQSRGTQDARCDRRAGGGRLFARGQGGGGGGGVQDGRAGATSAEPDRDTDESQIGREGALWSPYNILAKPSVKPPSGADEGLPPPGALAALEPSVLKASASSPVTLVARRPDVSHVSCQSCQYCHTDTVMCTSRRLPALLVSGGRPGRGEKQCNNQFRLPRIAYAEPDGGRPSAVPMSMLDGVGLAWGHLGALSKAQWRTLSLTRPYGISMDFCREKTCSARISDGSPPPPLVAPETQEIQTAGYSTRPRQRTARRGSGPRDGLSEHP
ncbi:predicted protein [Verticillium alfalfae VaMs.102]|uniref:Predicted protein n=1 Tax=Verticillium alfalfae (strain VaMs.102 / ATCC MYA-4576 / FGSC 10136) TaxID=526221 RepID=C9S9T0_VERA1|nr:predicted protein [Verticillium alfalfae VaMs.102]EEY16143.1 predicted protein [Verticillium alfalfae VaMs.102]